MRFSEPFKPVTAKVSASFGPGEDTDGEVGRLGSLSCRATRASLASCTEVELKQGSYLDLPGQAQLTHWHLT